MTEPPRGPRYGLALAALLLAFSLRSVLVVVAPLVDEIARDFTLTASGVSLLISIPVLCFALFAPLAPRASQRLGTERVLLACAVLIGAGSLLRIAPGSPALWLGTVILGGGIALANVLLPALVKDHFPGHVGLMTGLYMVAINGGASLAAILAVPIAVETGGWRTSTAVWAAPAFVAALAWLPQLRRASHVPLATPASVSLWRDPLAWQVTAFLGLQSVAFFSIATWLPAILAEAGLDRVAAGAQLSLLTFVGIPASLLAPVLAVRFRDQRLLACLSTLLTALGFAGFLLAPASAPALWSTLAGLGLGAAFSLAMTLIVLRSRDARQAASLSGMAQAAGYLLAAVVPVLLGALYDATTSWSGPLLILIGISLLQAGFGLYAGRRRYVGAAAA